MGDSSIHITIFTESTTGTLAIYYYSGDNICGNNNNVRDKLCQLKLNDIWITMSIATYDLMHNFEQFSN